MPAELYGILSILFLIGFAVFDLTRPEYTRSEKELSVYRVRDSNKTSTSLNLKTDVLPIPIVLRIKAIFTTLLSWNLQWGLQSRSVNKREIWNLAVSFAQ